jgi:hypothetical protein
LRLCYTCAVCQLFSEETENHDTAGEIAQAHAEQRNEPQKSESLGRVVVFIRNKIAAARISAVNKHQFK